MNFSIRNTSPEIMDNPEIAKSQLMAVFKDLYRTNRLLGGNSITLKEVEKLMRRHPRTSYTIIDLGCGDGSMLRKLALHCRNTGRYVSFIGLDIAEQTIEIAKESSLAFPEIQYLRADILQLEQTDLSCDILLCSLTLHHLSEEEIPLLLKQAGNVAKIGTVINDLQRNKYAYYLFMVFSAIFIKTKIAKHDGLLSIRRGFTFEELIAFSRELPQFQHRIKRRRGFRYIWVMETKSASTTA